MLTSCPVSLKNNMIKKLLKKYEEIIRYIIFGVLTTVVSIVSFKVFDVVLGSNMYLITNVISWIIAVAFAYITNKLWVFNSKSFKSSVVIKELISFFGARLFSLGVEELGLWILIALLHFNNISFTVFKWSVDGNLLSKFFMQFVVVVMNYIFSKFIIFTKKAQNNE